MRLASLMIAGLACAAASCSQPAQAPAAGDSASSPATGGAGGVAANAIEPGQYRTTMTIVSMDIPGVKQSHINMAPTTSEDCVTSSDIADFTRGSMVEADSGETCTQNSMNASGGHIEGAATCTGEHGSRTMHISGTYTSNHVEMDVTASGQMPGVAGQMTQHLRLVTDRTGACASGTN